MIGYFREGTGGSFVANLDCNSLFVTNILRLNKNNSLNREIAAYRASPSDILIDISWLIR